MAKATETADALPADPLTERALEKLQGAMPDAVVASDCTGLHPWIQVKAESIREVSRFLRDDDDLRLDCCHLISGVDWPGKGKEVGELEVVYHLVSYTRMPDADYRQRPVKNDPFVAIKVRVPRDAPDVPTVMDIWTGADWHERETFDLVGIRFTGRDELLRILLPEDWPGHPLRKDWEFPAEYHGTPIIPPEGL